MESVSAEKPRAVLAIARRPLPAWALSLLLHLTIVLVLAYWARFVPHGSSATTSDRTVGVALVSQAAEDREYTTTEALATARDATAVSEIAAALPSEQELQVDLAAVLPAGDSGLGVAEALALPGGGRTGDAAASQVGRGDRVSTSVFGTTGDGSRFVYVFDRSGSMAGYGGRPLAAAKRELSGSLDDLTDTNQFQIIFYNEEPHIFRHGAGRPRLVWATEDGRAAAKAFVRGISATGSTRHLEPLRMALGMHPDVVFFLTDADEPQLSRADLGKIRRWNQASTIHTIEFGFGPSRQGENFLMRLAAQNGGQHVYVDVSSLRTAR